MSKIEVGQAYTDKDAAYDLGATDAYRYSYGRYLRKDWTKELRSEYDRGYNDEPYGRKDYGYDEE